MKKPNYTLSLDPKQVAKSVLLTPDFESCTHVAETYLKNYTVFNQNKNFPGFTGTYLDKPVTVIAVGFGDAMMGFLAEDLYVNYGVESILYAGLCDSLKEEIAPRQYVLATDAESEETSETVSGDEAFCQEIKNDFEQRGELVNFKYEATILNVGSVISADRRFENAEDAKTYINEGFIAADTATASLFAMAEEYGKKAAALLLVDRNVITEEEMEDKEYQRTAMRQIAVALTNL